MSKIFQSTHFISLNHTMSEACPTNLRGVKVRGIIDRLPPDDVDNHETSSSQAYYNSPELGQPTIH
jgi:hypothetical protein